MISELDSYLFREGTHGRLHAMMGCVLDPDAATIRVWAPNASSVAVVGDFNAWSGGTSPLQARPAGSGVWEGGVAGVARGDAYKFRIVCADGSRTTDKADPYAKCAEAPRSTGSRAWTLEYEWGDDDGMASRAAHNAFDAPMSVYEVHLGSWRRGFARRVDVEDLRIAAHVGADLLDAAAPRADGEDRRRLAARARALRNATESAALRAMALDIAFQCAPDHPYVKDHPQWFRWRPDGTGQCAENPPKKSQDIHAFNFESAQWAELWRELSDVLMFWIGEGVRIFRVDNPHTKPFPFWEWAIVRGRREHPDVIFLAEAFTRPKEMHRLAKLGFTQSYTCFTWRNTKQELTEYFAELTQGPVQVHDVPTGARFLWNGPRDSVQLDPARSPAHIFRLRRRVRTERDFDYFL